MGYVTIISGKKGWTAYHPGTHIYSPGNLPIAWEEGEYVSDGVADFAHRSAYSVPTLWGMGGLRMFEMNDEIIEMAKTKTRGIKEEHYNLIRGQQRCPGCHRETLVSVEKLSLITPMTHVNCTYCGWTMVKERGFWTRRDEWCYQIDFPFEVDLCEKLRYDKKRDVAQRWRGRMRVYQCHLCGGWLHTPTLAMKTAISLGQYSVKDAGSESFMMRIQTDGGI